MNQRSKYSHLYSVYLKKKYLYQVTNILVTSWVFFTCRFFILYHVYVDWIKIK